MKTLSYTLLFLALASASGGVGAHDAHAAHGAANTQVATDPHAGHRGHAMPNAKATSKAKDPHAAHAMPAAAAVVDPPAVHNMSSMSASDSDPHAGHDMSTMRNAVADLHAGHVMRGDANPADPNAGHGMSGVDHNALDPHAGHVGHATVPTLPAPHTPIPTPTAEDFAAAFPVLKAHSMEHAPNVNYLVLFDHLEGWNNARGRGQSWASKAWFGTDTDRLWLRSEGERNNGRLETWSLDALYGHSISPWWDVVAGVRHERDGGNDLTRAAIGVQGLAPYKFEMSATALIGGARKAELEFEAEYNVLLTNRLILQPVIGASIAADDDPRRRVGSGLSHIETGLRLRYEITRRFAPYVGYVQAHSYGRTADLRRAHGEGIREARWVAGLRFWF